MLCTHATKRFKLKIDYDVKNEHKRHHDDDSSDDSDEELDNFLNSASGPPPPPPPAAAAAASVPSPRRSRRRFSFVPPRPVETQQPAKHDGPLDASSMPPAPLPALTNPMAPLPGSSSGPAFASAIPGAPGGSPHPDDDDRIPQNNGP